MSELPSGWSLARLPELIASNGTFVDGDWVESKDQDPKGDVRLIQLADIGDGRYINKSNRFLTHEKALDLGCTFLKNDDILIARMPDPLGRACIFPGDRLRAVTVVDVCIIRGRPEHFDKAWLMHFINSPSFRTNIHSLQSGSTRKRISRGNLSTLNLPIPPRAEQTRIVAKLDELLSDLDAGVSELKAAQKKLAQYRQSLLKAAVDGSLTAEWRKNNPPTETGAELLERILKERRTRWEAKLLAKFQEQSKTPPKDWQKKYPEPVLPSTTDLPELPLWWTLATTGLIAESIVPNRDKPLTFTGHIPWITTPDFEQTDLHLKKSISGFGLSENECEMYRARVVPYQSVIMTCVGRFGLSAVLDVRAVINQQLHAFVPESGVRAEYLAFVIQAQRNWLERNATSTTIAYLNKEKCESLPVPLPPVNEQDAVLKLLKPQLASITVKLRNVGFSLKQAAAQRQNILRAAFAGQLVPQDPNDEPASVLLERIRAERAAQGKPKARGRKKAAPEFEDPTHSG